jgi:hypothetical protein
LVTLRPAHEVPFVIAGCGSCFDHHWVILNGLDVLTVDFTCDLTKKSMCTDDRVEFDVRGVVNGVSTVENLELTKEINGAFYFVRLLPAYVRLKRMESFSPYEDFSDVGSTI